MNGSNIRRVYNNFKSIKFNQNIIIFGFFLLISCLFWFFNALSNEYNTEISIPVEYINSPESKLIAEVQASEIKIKITALGYRIINYKTTSTEPIIVSLKRHHPLPVEGSKNKKFYILTQTIKDEIISSIGKDLNISIISPDSLIFSMDEVIERKLPVRRNFEIGFKKQFMLKDSIAIFPDSIMVKGVKSKLDTISAVYTTFDRFVDLDGKHTFEMDLIKIPGTEFSLNRVSCNIDVEEFTEIKYELPIEVVNAPERLRIKIYPANAKVSVNVGFSRYKSIYKEQFRLIVDYKEAGESQVARLRVKMIKSPEHLSSVRIYPQSVDYIIEKND